MEVPYDRHDLVHVGPDGTTEIYRHSTLLTEAMGMVRSGCKLRHAYDRLVEAIKALRVQLDSILIDIGQVAFEIDAPNEGDDPLINPFAPPLSQT